MAKTKFVFVCVKEISKKRNKRDKEFDCLRYFQVLKILAAELRFFNIFRSQKSEQIGFDS